MWQSFTLPVQFRNSGWNSACRPGKRFTACHPAPRDEASFSPRVSPETASSDGSLGDAAGLKHIARSLTICLNFLLQIPQRVTAKAKVPRLLAHGPRPQVSLIVLYSISQSRNRSPKIKTWKSSQQNLDFLFLWINYKILQHQSASQGVSSY